MSSAPAPDPVAADAPAIPRGRLVLSRRDQESVMIGDDIEIMVLSVTATTVKIGVRAPRDLRIVRGEVFEALIT